MGGMVYYGEHDGTFALKFVGEIRCTLGVCLDTFLEQQIRRGDYDAVRIDLTETSVIDSTNLGLLARIANQMKSRGRQPVTLISTNEDITTVLESVGFDSIFDIRHDARAALPADRPLPLEDPTETSLSKTVLESHQELSALNEENRRRFQSVIDAVEEQAKGDKPDEPSRS